MPTYTVPAKIKALKPANIPCDVKVVKGYYYVYARGERVPDPKHPGRKKNTTGKLIGKIENGAFIPKESPIRSVTDFAESPDTLDYGAYAIAVQCSTQIVERLKKYFTISDSLTIYTIALIWFVNGFTPASRPVAMSSTFFKQLGNPVRTGWILFLCKGSGTGDGRSSVDRRWISEMHGWNPEERGRLQSSPKRLSGRTNGRRRQMPRKSLTAGEDMVMHTGKGVQRGWDLEAA